MRKVCRGAGIGKVRLGQNPALQQVHLGLAQGFHLGQVATGPAPVEVCHQFSGATVVHLPQRGDHRLRALQLRSGSQAIPV
jgi:hypothetical protein